MGKRSSQAREEEERRWGGKAPVRGRTFEGPRLKPKEGLSLEPEEAYDSHYN